jgi:hypothetical protein
MNLIINVLSLTFSDGNDAMPNSRNLRRVTIVANIILWLSSWTLVLAATMHATHHGPLALSLVSFSGIACVVAERHFPCVATRVTLAACVLTLYQRSRAALVSPYVEIVILSVYSLLLFFEWLIIAHGVYDSSMRHGDRANTVATISSDGLHGSDIGLPDFRGDPELARLLQILSEGVYLAVAALPSSDYSLASVGHNPLRLAVGLLMLVFCTCNVLGQTLSGSSIWMADPAFRNAMMVTHTPYSWCIPLARAIGDISISIATSRMERRRTNV